MSAAGTFGEFLCEQLAPLGPVALRRMFGSTGLFCEGVMFGVVRDDTLYFRVDAGNRADLHEGASLPPLSYKRQGRTVDLPFWRAPDRLLDEPQALVAWARSALAAAHRVAAKRDRTAPGW